MVRDDTRGRRLGRLRRARADELEPYADLSTQLRERTDLAEQRTPGTFHRGSQSFLNFHADDAGVVADVEVAGRWERMALRAGGEALLLARVDEALEAPRG